MTNHPTWPGTDLPKSTDNAFSAHKTGERSIFAQDTQFQLHAGRFKTSQRAAVVLANKHSGTFSRAGAV